MSKQITREELENFGSLITLKGTNECLGDLMSFDGRGTFDPSYGLVPVNKDEADAHNKALDLARLEGMDKNCQIGQGSFAYWSQARIITFIGTVISSNVSINGNSITFVRAGKTYRGRKQKDFNCFNFKRVK